MYRRTPPLAMIVEINFDDIENLHIYVTPSLVRRDAFIYEEDTLDEAINIEEISKKVYY